MITRLLGKTSAFHFGHGLIRILGLLLLLNLFTARLASAATTEAQIAALKDEKNEAIFSVQHLVNQPVKRFKRTDDMNVGVFSSGWFHEGAVTPDFEVVDIRVGQETPYLGHKYVTSNLNPGVAFLGDELEFNRYTKYFYTDRSLPKKKLTVAEMLQINDLYRTIGRCNRELEALQNPPSIWLKTYEWTIAHKPVVVALVVTLVVVLFVVRRKRTVEFED